MLQDQSVAYLADEVGMGKTYVALGAMALLRHFQPQLRVVVMAPKENIQLKWIKEWRNFVNRIVKVEDLRVKGIGGYPARALVKADSLVDFVTEASNDPDRDFFIRLTSFSLPVADGSKTLDVRRDQLVRAIPWLQPGLLDARNKQNYTRNFGRAVNCALPDIDLLIVDEAHNLKAGWRDGSSSTRNTVIGCALGGRDLGDEVGGKFKGYRRRVKRILFLSATPIEYDIRQLWNQLDLFGFSDGWSELNDKNLTHEQHRVVVRRVLVRRTAELLCGDRRMTKSEYRREWRAGGIATHDEPLRIKSDRQRLAVALVQKKVSEILGSGRQNHSFQVGLLASFESFLETIRNKVLQHDAPAEEERADTIFYGSTEELGSADEAREGVDVDSVNRIARDHLKVFQRDMPHPKMDALVAELSQSFHTGRKALVFVRRVASVDELQRKLEESYDALLFNRLQSELRTESLRGTIQHQKKAYHEARAASRHNIRARDVLQNGGEDEAETSSVDSFFAWFFRGDGPKGIKSGASIAEQIDRPTGNYSTLLEDNYVAYVLGSRTEDVVERLAATLQLSVPDALDRVARTASRYLKPSDRIPRRLQMQAFQCAALDLLSETQGEISQCAKAILRETFTFMKVGAYHERVIPNASDWLSTKTFFSELRLRDRLRESIWPTLAQDDFAAAFREQELRRELMSTMIRKGHPIVDLFILIANRLGTLRQGVRETTEGELATEFLDELEKQRDEAPGQFHSFYELSEAADKFRVIVQLNAPDIDRKDLSEVHKMLGKTLRAQRPVAGMAGKVNSEVVRQFRMPGYPLILITTDLLKEGEDLHTFCSSVYHYGVAWMPSELEQRVGRIDRVGSQTERRLLGAKSLVDDADLMQVYYPHLRETVEVLQLRRVYERLNKFMRIMHDGLGAPPKETAEISVVSEGLRSEADIEAIKTPLKSAFRVTPSMLVGHHRSLVVSAEDAERTRQRLDAIEELVVSVGATDVERSDVHQIVGEMPLGSRRQPFTIFLRSLHGRPMLRCISPVGQIDRTDWDDDRAESLLSRPFTRIALELNEKFDAYNVAVEGDILLAKPHDDRVRATILFESVIKEADKLEEALLGVDSSLTNVKVEFQEEVKIAR
jgi:hypothetical protein